MYNKILNDLEYESEIKNFIEKQYDFSVDRISPAKRGSYGETWHIEAQGKRYFVKIHFLSSIIHCYKNSLELLDYLKKNNFEFINYVIPSKSEQLYYEFKNGILAVFSYIEGELVSRGELQTEQIYELLINIYHVPINSRFPAEDFSLFPAEGVLAKVKEYAVFPKYLFTLEKYYDMMRDFSERCKCIDEKAVLTHGDIGNNLMKNDGRLYIIDWDYARIAYPERDIWFMLRSVEEYEKIKAMFNQNGINIPLRKERLLYYSLHSFFFHFLNHMVDIEETTDERKKRLIINYTHRLFFNSFINEQIEFLLKM